MSTIEELEAEVAAAEKRFNEARDDLNAAKRQLQMARNEASGIIGHVLQFEETRGWRPQRTIISRIIVDRVEIGWNGVTRALGCRVRRDGSVGTQRAEVAVSRAKDLGPYVALSGEQEKSR